MRDFLRPSVTKNQLPEKSSIVEMAYGHSDNFRTFRRKMCSQRAQSRAIAQFLAQIFEEILKNFQKIWRKNWMQNLAQKITFAKFPQTLLFLGFRTLLGNFLRKFQKCPKPKKEFGLLEISLQNLKRGFTRG